MAIHAIRLFGDPGLREPARDVEEFGLGLKRLAADLADTMQAAHGAGLAAPQIGVQRRIFAFDIGEGPEFVVNPELSDPAGEFSYDEGCLSLPGIFIEIVRPDEITCRFQDLDGGHHEVRASGLLGRVFQHENLHLEGKLFFEDAPRSERKDAMRAIRETMQSGITSYVPDPAAHSPREEEAI